MLNEYPLKQFELPLKEYIKVKSPNSYSDELLKNIKMISFYPDGIATPFGSFIYAMQKYPGDVDLIQDFAECCDADHVVDLFIKQLHRVTRDILAAREHYFSEFKAGLDYDYDYDIGPLKNGKWLVNEKLYSHVIDMYAVDLFNENETATILYILESELFDADGYDLVNNIFRNRRILRWSADEILKGEKIVNDKKIYLFDALKDDTIVKIDMLALYDHRFIEMTNILTLSILHPDGDHEIINFKDANRDLRLELPFDIEKLFFSNYFYSPFKAVKRIFAVSRNYKDGEVLRRIIPLLTGNISLLYQIKSELDVLDLIFERAESIPIATINFELGQMKNRISNVLQLDDNVKESYYKTIDRVIHNNDPNETKQALLKAINSSIKKIVNYNTIIYLDKVDMNPIPRRLGNVEYSARLLPDSLRYPIFKREPNDNPNLKKDLIPDNLQLDPKIKKLRLEYDDFIDYYPEQEEDDLPKIELDEEGHENIKDLKKLIPKKIKADEQLEYLFPEDLEDPPKKKGAKKSAKKHKKFEIPEKGLICREGYVCVKKPK